MNLSKITPIPQIEKLHGGKISLGTVGNSNCKLILKEKNAPLAIEAYEILKAKLKSILFLDGDEDFSGKISIILEISKEVPEEIKKNPEQSYRILTKGSKIILTGYGELGLYYAVRSLIQTFEFDGHSLSVPKMTVIDYPDLKTRGHFMESSWGTTFMELCDWKNLIDDMASMKLNQLVIGLYGCWRILSPSKARGENVLIDIPEFPKLRTDKFKKYYSAKKACYVNEKHRIPMAEKDFFGEIVSYGKKHGIEVFPLWNSYGHNSLIPRMYPEVAPIVEGEKSKIGLCVSSPKTYEMLFKIYDYIIDKYLKPNGITSFHLGLDEVRKESCHDKENLLKVFSPFCECSECSKLTNQEKSITHTVKLVSYLKKKGMKNIYMYNDLPSRIFCDPKAFCDAFREKGLLDEVVIDWWSYTDIPENALVKTTYPELKMRSTLKHWNGYYNVLPKVAIRNIRAMSEMAINENAEGVQSYASTDSALDINNVAIAEYSWNFYASGESDDYISQYASRKFAHQQKAAREAFTLYKELTQETGERLDKNIETSVTPHFLDTLRHGAFGAIKPNSKKFPRCYPGEALTLMLNHRDYFEPRLINTEALASKTYLAMSKLTDIRDNCDLSKQYAVASRLYRDLAGDMLTILKMHDIIASGDKNARIKVMKLAEKRKLNRIEAMAKQEEITPDFLLSARLRNQSVYYQLFADIEAYAKSTNSKTFALDLFDTDNISSKRYIELR